MLRAELVKKLAININIPETKAEQILIVLLEGIILGVCQDGKTVIINFGIFRNKQINKSDRYCHFIRKKLKIPARKIPIFKASKQLKKIVDSD